MQIDIEYDTLDEALRRCGASWDAAQAHGLLSSRLAIEGPAAGTGWMHVVLEGTAQNDALRAECAQLLDTLFKSTWVQLAERLSGFSPLLPGEEDSPDDRTAALAHWCEGFLHGLVSVEHSADLKERLAAEPLADIIRDMLQITRATVDAETDEETNESAYAELVEYLRVAAQLAYEELADIRHPGGLLNGSGDTLH